VWTVAAVRQIVPAFYALGDTRTPVFVSAVDLCAFIALAVVLRGPMGPAGVSAAVAGSSALQMALLLGAIFWRLGEDGAEQLRAIGRSAARVAIASAAAGIAGWAAAILAAPRSGGDALSRALPAIAGAMAFGAVFLPVAWGMRAPELDEILTAAKRRFARKVAA